jgi:diaminopimelate epimerase
MRFAKYHGLGNDYLVVQPAAAADSLSPEMARWLCDRNYGIGSDGVVYGPLPHEASGFRLRFYNPDGSEFEKSGNGLRIFARYLWDCGLVSEQPFCVHTPGGDVHCSVQRGGKWVTVEIGQVRFGSQDIPVAGPQRDVLGESIRIHGEEFIISAATVGNPHCVVMCAEISRPFAEKWGPFIENHDLFPNRTNVQFMKLLDRKRIQIEIWERGAGYTLASGTSSCAAAAVACRLGLCDREVTVVMPGGQLEVALSADYWAVLAGPVAKICEGTSFEDEAYL